MIVESLEEGIFYAVKWPYPECRLGFDDIDCVIMCGAYIHTYTDISVHNRDLQIQVT